jgi:hypothetical protein
MLERSPPHLFFVPALFLAKKENKRNRNKKWLYWLEYLGTQILLLLFIY